MRKLKKQNGFTLVEMLIVVAIIAILIAVSIPMVGSALERSRVAVDQANERDAIGLATANYLTQGKGWLASGAINKGDKLELYYYVLPDSKQGVIGALMGAGGYGFDYGRSTKEGRGDNDAIPEGKGIRIIMTLDGQIEKLEWIEEPTSPGG